MKQKAEEFNHQQEMDKRNADQIDRYIDIQEGKIK